MIEGLRSLTNTVSLYERFRNHRCSLASFDYSLCSLAALKGPPAFQANLLWHRWDFKNLTTKGNRALSDCNWIFCLYQVKWISQIHLTTLVYIAPWLWMCARPSVLENVEKSYEVAKTKKKIRGLRSKRFAYRERKGRWCMRMLHSV